MPLAFQNRRLQPFEAEELAELELLRQLRSESTEKDDCRESLLAFFRRAWREIDPAPFELNWHHEVIIEQLESLARGEIRDLICNIPPRCTKSILVSVCFPAWLWIQEWNNDCPLMGPHCSFLAVSYGASLAEVMAVKMRRLVMGEWYQRLWGDRVKITPDQASRSDFGNTAGGERISNSIEGGILGRGALLQIIDDPHKLDSVESDTERERTIRALSEGLTTRVTDPRISARILIMQRLHGCLLPGVPVRTPKGEAAIETLQVGDLVLGSDGWQPVEATDSHEHDGEIVAVRLFGHPAICRTTPDHRYLTRRGWIEAHDLKINDWVRLSKPQEIAADVRWEAPRIAAPPRAPSGSFNGRRRITIRREELAVLVTAGNTNTAIGRHLGVHRNTIQCYLWLYGIGRIRDRNMIVGEEHLGEPMFWRIVGYWLAEGCFMKGRGIEVGIRYTFHLKERAFIEEISAFFSKHDIEVKEHEVTEDSVCQMEVNCSQIARWLRDNFGVGARNKEIPEFVFGLSDECRSEILEGWLRGDGCVRTKGPLAGLRSGTSASLALIQGMQRIAISLGRRAMVVSGSNGSRTGKIRERVVTSGPAWELRLPEGARRQGSVRMAVDAEAAWCRVREITREPYKGPVFDITTASHDFVVGNATVHNSDATDYALRQWREDLVHVMLPMRFNPDYACPLDRRTRQGELLWPAVWNEDEVAREERGLGPYAAAGQLGQVPVPRGGGIIKSEWLEPWPPTNPDGSVPHDMVINGRIQYPALEYVVACVDTAFTSKQERDRSAMAVLGVFRAEGRGRIVPRPDGEFERIADDYGFPKVLLLYGWAKRLELHGPPIEGPPPGVSPQEWSSPMRRRRREMESWGLVETVADTCRRYKVDHLRILSLGQGHGLEQELRRLHSDGDWGVEMEPERGDKIARAYAMQHLFSSHQIYVPMYEDGTRPTWCGPLIDELLLFPRHRHDDFVDALMGAVRHLREIGMFERREEFSAAEAQTAAWRPNRRNSLPYEI